MAKTGIRLILLCVSAIFTIALTGCNNGYPPLHNAVSWGDKKAVERLLSKGADVNAKATITITAFGSQKRAYEEITPLHLATDKGNKELVKFLISRGADVNAKATIIISTCGGKLRGKKLPPCTLLPVKDI